MPRTASVARARLKAHAPRGTRRRCRVRARGVAPRRPGSLRAPRSGPRASTRGSGRPRRPSSRVRGHRRTNRRVRFALRRGFPLLGVLLGVPHRLRGDRRARGDGRSPRGGASETPGEGGRGREPSRRRNSDRPPRRRTPAEPLRRVRRSDSRVCPARNLGARRRSRDWMKRRERTLCAKPSEGPRSARCRSSPSSGTSCCAASRSRRSACSARGCAGCPPQRRAARAAAGEETRGFLFFHSFRVRATRASATRSRRVGHTATTMKTAPAPFYSRRTTTKTSRRTGG